jgi:phosphomethylpyrimidine synthase
MAQARKNLDWEEQMELAINSGEAKQLRQEYNSNLKDEDACTMCGSFCALKVVEKELLD